MTTESSNRDPLFKIKRSTIQKIEESIEKGWDPRASIKLDWLTVAIEFGLVEIVNEDNPEMRHGSLSLDTPMPPPGQRGRL
jgi:hypothetical protein